MTESGSGSEWDLLVPLFLALIRLGMHFQNYFYTPFPSHLTELSTCGNCDFSTCGNHIWFLRRWNEQGQILVGNLESHTVRCLSSEGSHTTSTPRFSSKDTELILPTVCKLSGSICPEVSWASCSLSLFTSAWSWVTFPCVSSFTTVCSRVFFFNH